MMPARAPSLQSNWSSVVHVGWLTVLNLLGAPLEPKDLVCVVGGVSGRGPGQGWGFVVGFEVPVRGSRLGWKPAAGGAR